MKPVLSPEARLALEILAEHPEGLASDEWEAAFFRRVQELCPTRWETDEEMAHRIVHGNPDAPKPKGVIIVKDPKA